MTEPKRDLAADLALCEAATPGPWTIDPDDERNAALGHQSDGNALAVQASGVKYYPAHCYSVPDGNGRGGGGVANARFIAAARAGWPHAIRRAMEAEASNEELERLFDLTWEADLRGSRRWRAAGVGRELKSPDRADLVVFLLDTIEKLERRAE